jgi:hypothetical protein
LLDYVLEVRTVRIVAGRALSLGKRRMGDLWFFFFRFFMTGKTQFSALYVQKMFVLGSMGRVTGKTSLLIGHRGMLERDLLALLFMAIDAEVIHSFLFEFRVLGSMCAVTS